MATESPPTAAPDRTAGRPSFVPELDGLRALAVLIVLWEHSPRGVTDGLLPGADHLGRWLLGPGYLGVDLFFVLSGFLITRILLADAARGAPLKLFWIRRFLRIFPIYYLLLAIVWIVRPGPELPWCAAYLANFYIAYAHPGGPLLHTWSLSVEEHFYLFWPLAVYWLRPSASRALILFAVIPGAILSAVGIVAYFGAGDPDAGVNVAKLTFTRALSLGAGCLIAFGEGWVRSSRARTSTVAGGLVVTACLTGTPAVFVLWNHYLVPYTGAAIPLHWIPALNLVSYACLSTAAVLLAITWSESRAPHAWLLRRASLRAVGRVSYGLYLYHFPIYYALGVLYPPGVETPGPAALPDTALAIGLSFAAATVSYFAVERPLLAVGSRFRHQSSAAA